MKVQVLSDLHCEFHKDGGKSLVKECKTDADVLVIAGDLDTQSHLQNTLSMFCSEYKDVVFVIGNHEYYHSSFEEVKETCEKAKAENKNLHILDGSLAIINGKRFLGGTLWFRDSPTNVFFQPQMNDFHVIKDLRKWVTSENNRVINFIEVTTVPGDIVVTHHMPSQMSVDEAYKTSNLNRFFVCDMEHVMMNQKPSLWFHGHGHSSKDYLVDETRVICNPFGYARYESNSKFVSQLVIEI